MDTITTVNVTASEWTTNLAILEAGLADRETVDKLREFTGLVDFDDQEEVVQLIEKLQSKCSDVGFVVETELEMERIRFEQWKQAVIERELKTGRADLRCRKAIGGNDWPDSLRARLAIYRQYRGFDAYEAMAA